MKGLLRRDLPLWLGLFIIAMAQPAVAQQYNVQRQGGTLMADTTTGRVLLNQTLDLMERYYVETPNVNKASEKALVTMLAELDPHSVFIPQRNVERANEGLNGSFEGVGISFTIQHDTIQVADVIVGGPSEKVGLMVGDKIVTIDDKPATGDTVNNSFVAKHLRGKKGTRVKIGVLRGSNKELIHFTIVRDKVPIYSVDSHFMLDDHTGYVRLTRFARTSANEVQDAINELKKQGMTQLVFDLRGNTGGYLDIACAVADQFLPADKLIVYQEGRKQPRQNFKSTARGCFINGPLVILIDENSASAAEIVSGAMQDWDRATIVGRRSFGKGLVQRMYTLHDGSQLRLTTARYYTPSGRCIQKPYDKGSAAYRNDLAQRYLNGELTHADSIHLPDSLKYRTSKGRTVYGGGGITPDVFVPMDTLRLSDYYLTLRSKGLLNEFCNDFGNAHRGDAQLKDFDSFLQHYDSYNVDQAFADFAREQGVEASEVKGDWVAGWVNDQFKKQLKDSTNTLHASNYEDYIVRWQSDTTFMNALMRKARAEDTRSIAINERSNQYLKVVLKALIARALYGSEYYYRVMKDIDNELQTGWKVLQK